MCHILLQDPRFFQLLLQIDVDLAAQTLAGKCPCGGALHNAASPQGWRRFNFKIACQRTIAQRERRTIKLGDHTQLHKNKAELLLVLERPEIPLHTNGSEGDIRGHVLKQKISGGTRSDLGRQCRDTFSSLKKTCRKLGISFWSYLIERISGSDQIQARHSIIEQRIAAAA